MALFLAILLWLLLFVLVMVGVALITPTIVRVHLTTSPKVAYHVEIRVWGGLAPRVIVAKGPVAKPKPAKPKPPKTSQSKRIRGSVVQAVPSLIGGILHRFHFLELHIDADYGLGDPADTGQLCGLLMPLQYACPLPASVSLDLRPDFTETCLRGSATASIRVTVATLLIPIAQFIWRAFGPRR